MYAAMRMRVRRYEMEDAELKYEVATFKAIVINFDFKSIIKECGWLKTIWGYDIFLNKVPLLKSLVMANVIVWALIILAR